MTELHHDIVTEDRLDVHLNLDRTELALVLQDLRRFSFERSKPRPIDTQ